MLSLFIEAIGYGLFLSILIGPLLMALIETSIKSGKKKALSVAIGIWISDIIIVLGLLNLGHKDLIHLSDFTLRMLAFISAIVFVSVGVLYVFKGKKNSTANKFQTPDKITWYMIKGFLINTINPFTFVFWASLATSHILLQRHSNAENYTFFGTLLCMIIITDTLKIFLAHKISPMLQSKYIDYLKIFSGLVFLITGAYIIYKFW
ncbi:MAG: hypothetical protein RLZZ546_2784 [Bacteroidota bacterium]|jgi:threonine/homoserine/homoserine lactone efflux protein